MISFKLIAAFRKQLCISRSTDESSSPSFSRKTGKNARVNFANQESSWSAVPTRQTHFAKQGLQSKFLRKKGLSCTGIEKRIFHCSSLQLNWLNLQSICGAQQAVFQDKNTTSTKSLNQQYLVSEKQAEIQPYSQARICKIRHHTHVATYISLPLEKGKTQIRVLGASVSTQF